MKKWIALLLATLMLAACACAETAVCATETGDVYFAADGLKAQRADGEIVDAAAGEIVRLFADGGDVYYVKSVSGAEGADTDGVYTSDVWENTLYRLGADGAETQIGEPQKEYYAEKFNENFASLGAYTAYNAYRDLTVYNGAIYYIGNDAQPGAYFTEAIGWEGSEEPQRFETAFDCGAAVWRMNLDGSEPVMLISGLGNGGAHLAVANDRIAVSSCFVNAVYAYDFTNFMLYDLDGNLLKTVANGTEGRHASLYKEDCEFTVITDAITTDGETIYASLSDSEGDYASSRFVDTANVDETLALEAFFTPSKLCGDGFVYLTSGAAGVGYEEGMAETLTLHFRSLADGSDTRLANVPAAFADAQMKLDVLDGTAYLRSGKNVLRVPLVGGEAELWDGVAFAAEGEAAAAELVWSAPEAEAEVIEEAEEEIAEEEVEDEYYLPDSDTRLYTREELEQYDTETLGFMRNEILARHGYPFKKDMYKNYFGSKSWYTRDEKFEYGCLSRIEMDNVETIKKIEASR